MRDRLKIVYLGAIFCFLGIAIFSSQVWADNVVQSFSSTQKLNLGSIVSVGQKAIDQVQATEGNRADLIFGVVVDKNLAPITLENSTANVYVASQGQYSVLVDNENGPIAVGDYISMSSSAGIGAKANDRQSVVLGKALSAFDGTTNTTGDVGPYKAGRVSVNIDITKNPSFKNTLAIPGSLQKIGNSIAGRETSPLKIYVALVVFTVATVLTLILLMVGTRGGLMAIGRNPLSKHSVLKALSQVVVAAILIFIASLIGVYLLLRL